MVAKAHRALEVVAGGPTTSADYARRPHLCSVFLCALTALSLSGCYQRSVLPQSEGHITTPSPRPAIADVPPPARVSDMVPPPKPTTKAPTYSVVVNEVPVKELLLAVARDTKQNIDIHPGLQGVVSLNAINETLPAILDRVSKQVNMRYKLEANTIIVSPDTAYMKTYKVNYVNMTRETTSTIGVSGQIGGAGTSSTSGATPGAGGGTGSAGQANASSTIVKTVSNNNFWDSMRDNIRAILVSTRNQSVSSEQRAERAESQRAAREERLQQAEAVARAGQAAPQLFSSVFGGQTTPLPVAGDVREDIIVNPVTGTISVFATEKQHALVQQHIDSITQMAQRQVLIEATIAEVTLSDAYQGGIDWSRLAVSGGINLTQSLLGTITGTATNPTVFPGSLTVGYTNPTSSVGNIAATVKLLNQFGNTRVLSSPKLMALNNQTALLKVVDNLVYFHLQAQPAIVLSGSTSTAQQATFTTTAETVPVGVVMSLTPQINSNGQVTLSVRPTISRVLSFINDPNPALALAGVTSPVPQIQTREMESVLQLISGQTAVLGGLMQDNSQYLRSAIPGAGNPNFTGFLSELFSARNDSVIKSELVIFLRPTVITNPSLDSDELKLFQRMLPKQTETPTANVPGESVTVPR
jgi:MSHA type pilus biogenesis protein MshL